MLDDITDFMRSCAAMKKTCIFFAVFAATLSVIGGTFTVNAPNEADAPPDAAIAVTDISEETPASPKISVPEKPAEKNNLPSNATASTASALRDETEKPTQPQQQNEGHIVKSNIPLHVEPAAIFQVSMERSHYQNNNMDDNELAEDTEAPSNTDEPNGFIYNENIPMSYELQKFTYEKCADRGLEYELVLAVMWRESRFQTDAVNVNSNGTKDSGIMQINDVNRQWLYERYGIEDLMDPYQNINAGTAMLSQFADKYGIHGALMAYQYGEGGMTRRLNAGQTTSDAVEMAYQQRDYYRNLV